MSKKHQGKYLNPGRPGETILRLIILTFSGQHDVGVHKLLDSGGDLNLDWTSTQQTKESEQSPQSFGECKL